METIFYDPKFWASVEEKLKIVYVCHCLPELVEAAQEGIGLQPLANSAEAAPVQVARDLASQVT